MTVAKKENTWQTARHSGQWQSDESEFKISCPPGIYLFSKYMFMYICIRIYAYTHMHMQVCVYIKVYI